MNKDIKKFTETDFAIKAEIEKYLKTVVKNSLVAREAVGSWKETLESEDVLLILKKLNTETVVFSHTVTITIGASRELSTKEISEQAIAFLQGAPK